MNEIFGDAFDLFLNNPLDFDILCITTNGFVKEDGRAVMGAGIAKQARDNIKGIDLKLGSLIKANGNIIQQLATFGNKEIISFPVKHNWWEEADYTLIVQSLNALIDYANGRKVLIPRPGCGNGGLKWHRLKSLIGAWDYPNFYFVDFDRNITIKNIKDGKPSQPWEVVVDRTSPLGNPYELTEEEKRNSVCARYDLTIRNAVANKSPDFMNELNRLLSIYKHYGKLDLYCWCYPKRCHAISIRNVLVELLDGDKITTEAHNAFPI